MAHRFRIREIARQSGLSEATVDRVLHQRPGVRPDTTAQVQRAIEELRHQESQLQVGGRTLMVDLVMDSSHRFRNRTRTALEQALPDLRPAIVRARFHLTESAPVDDLVRTLDKIGRRGSDGVILAAPDNLEIIAAVGRLEQAGVPVVTLVTDLPGSVRRAYVGLDNRAAGSTAAYLLAGWLRGRSGSILVTRGTGDFRGEDDREVGFRATLRDLDPQREVIDLANRDEDDQRVAALVTAAAAEHPALAGVYAMYSFGAISTVVDALERLGHAGTVVVAHDLDPELVDLLGSGRVAAVLHHDLRDDLRRACRLLLQASGPARTAYSAVQVITPWNLPPR